MMEDHAGAVRRFRRVRPALPRPGWNSTSPTRADLDWRLTHLEWRQRVLLRRYPPEGKRVLDFGCMDGVFTIRLQQLGAQAVGYDISPAAVGQAKSFRGAAARPVFTTVPPGPGQFDLIYCSEALENVADDSALVGELVGYLARGGSVVGTTPFGDEGKDPAKRRDLRSSRSSSERCHPMAGYTSSTTRAVRSATACRSGRPPAGGSSSSRLRRRILRLTR